MAVQKPSKHGRDHVGGGEDPIPSLAMWPIKVFRDDIPITTGDGKFIWLIPEDLDGHTLVKVESFVSTSGSGATTVQLRKVGVGDMLTTKVTVDSGEKNSKDAGAQPEVDEAAADVAWGDHIAFDVDEAASGATGLGVYCYFLAGPDAIPAIRGPQGAQGPQGDDGPTGPQGPQGDPGGVVSWTGEWDSGTTYSVDDAVSHNGSSYVAIQGSTDVEPGVDAGWEDYWMVLADGVGSVTAGDVSVVDGGGLLSSTDVEAALAEIIGFMGMRRLYDSTLGSDTAAIDTGANGISQGHSHLLVLMLLRTTEAIVGSSATVQVNNDSGSNYDLQRTTVSNTTVTGGITLAGSSWTFGVAGANAQTGSVSPILIVIPSYTQTTFHKNGLAWRSVLEDTAADGVYQSIAIRWRSTTAVSRLAVTAGSGNLLTGSRMSIYGLL